MFVEYVGRFLTYPIPPKSHMTEKRNCHIPYIFPIYSLYIPHSYPLWGLLYICVYTYRSEGIPSRDMLPLDALDTGLDPLEKYSAVPKVN